MRLSDVQLYYDLAQTSGGQAVQISKSELSLATGIIEDSLADGVVRARGAACGEHHLIKYSAWITVVFLSSR